MNKHFGGNIFITEYFTFLLNNNLLVSFEKDSHWEKQRLSAEVFANYNYQRWVFQGNLHVLSHEKFINAGRARSNRHEES